MGGIASFLSSIPISRKLCYNHYSDKGGIKMEKTYKLLNNYSPLLYEEIEKQYDGYWIYLVNVNYSDEGRILNGVPVIMGSMPYDGAEDGIYEKYKAVKYEKRIGVSLLPNDSFISCLHIIGVENE